MHQISALSEAGTVRFGTDVVTLGVFCPQKGEIDRSQAFFKQLLINSVGVCWYVSLKTRVK